MMNPLTIWLLLGPICAYLLSQAFEKVEMNPKVGKWRRIALDVFFYLVSGPGIWLIFLAMYVEKKSRS